MFEYYQAIITSQYLAAFQTLEHCIDACPEEQWTGKVANHSFSRSAFHALFFADLYLGDSIQEMKVQPFHQENSQYFGDYEELQATTPTNTYEKGFVGNYLNFCQSKTTSVLGRETEATLKKQSDIPWQEISRGELHIYNIRHIQHHAAQLIMRLRLDTPIDIGWVKSA